jgi:hypothetical protein
VRDGTAVTSLDDWRLSIFGSKMFLLYMPNPHLTRAVKTFVDYILERSRPLIAPSLYRDRVDP